jgi:hypothetical protein
MELLPFKCDFDLIRFSLEKIVNELDKTHSIDGTKKGN